LIDNDGSEDKDAKPPPAVELAGVSSCFGEAVSIKSPLAIGPAIGFFGDATGVTPLLVVTPVRVVRSPKEAMNDRVLNC
jgi:hypothetical protein